MESRSRYVYGSAAPNLPQRPERQPTRPTEKRRIKVSRVTPPAYGHVPKAKLLFCVIMLAAMCFVMLYRFSILSDLNTTMNRMNEKYNALRNENRILKVEIETSIDLDRVKQVAETEMGMHKPDRFQIIPVSVPKNDYTVVLDQQYIDEASGAGKPIMESILDAIKAVFR